MIIHRAFIKEVLQTFSVATVILFSIFLVTRLVDFLSEVADGDIPLNSVLVFLLLKMIVYIDVIFPLVIYISILLVMGRWIKDNELVVINACGIGLESFIRPLVILFIIIGSMVSVFSLYLSPLSAETYRSLQLQNQARTNATGIAPGVFTKTADNKGVYFVESYNPLTNNFADVFIYTGDKNERDILVADTAHKRVDDKTNDEFLVLENGSKYRNQPGSEFYTVTEFEAYGVFIRHQPVQETALPIDAQPTFALFDNDSPGATGELNWRISKIVMLPILMLLALCFSSVGYRKNRFPAMVVALLVYFTYSNLLGLMASFNRHGGEAPIILLWLVHLVFLVTALYFFSRRKENRRLIPGLA